MQQHPPAAASEASQQLLAQVQTQWKGWRPYFVKLLRDVFGEDGLLIANPAGPMSLPGLNGVTIEMEWCGTDMAACLAAIESSRAVTEHAPLDVFWLTQAQQVPPPVQCRLVYEMAGRFNDGSVYAGSDWYDGSHIVCNTSAADLGGAYPPGGGDSSGGVGLKIDDSLAGAPGSGQGSGWRYTVEASRLNNGQNVFYDSHHHPETTDFAHNFGPGYGEFRSFCRSVA